MVMKKFPNGFQGNVKETKVSGFFSLSERKQETISTAKFHDEAEAYIIELQSDRNPSPASIYMAEKIFREAICAAPDLLSEEEAINFLVYNQKRYMKPHDRSKPPTEEQVRKARDMLENLIASGAVIRTPPPYFLHLRGSDPYGYLT